MKRTLSLLLALVMIFALAACGAKEEEPVANTISFKVVITDLEGNETAFEYISSADSVGEAVTQEIKEWVAKELPTMIAKEVEK